MTRQDLILKWAAYGVALVLVAALGYYILGPMPMELPLLLPLAAVAGGTLEGPPFGALYGALAGVVMAGVGHVGLGCVPALAAAGWLSGVVTEHVLRRDFWGHMLCCAVTMAAWEAWQVGSRLLDGTASPEVLLGVAGPELLWSLLFAPLVYWVGRFCCVHYGRIYHE